jgi:dipeptidase E
LTGYALSRQSEPDCGVLNVRLYLSSFGLGNAPENLAALSASSMRAAVIVNALDNVPQARSGWLQKQIAELSKLGFSVQELDLRCYFGDPDGLRLLLDSVDVVWGNGGNSFILRRAMKQSGFDMLVRNALMRDSLVYAGFSAAAVIAAPSLRGLEFVDDPNNAPAGYDREIVWEGLGLVPFSIVVHYRSDHSESALMEQEVAHFEASGTPYRTLRDGEALLVDGDLHTIVGWATSEPKSVHV